MLVSMYISVRNPRNEIDLIHLPLLEVHLGALGTCPTTFSGLSQDTRKQGLVCGQCEAH